MSAVHHQPAQPRGAAAAKSKSASPFALALREELSRGLRPLGDCTIGNYHVQIGVGTDSIWAVVSRAAQGGLAIRAAFVPGGFCRVRRVQRERGETMRLEAHSAIGTHRIAFVGTGTDLHRLQVRTWLTPDSPLLVPFLPRDLYPLDADDDPLGAVGEVEAAQRGPNTGLIYFALSEPAFGHVLYVQDLTGLNDYFRATRSAPMGAVGGEWPELGYLPPIPPQSGTPPVNPLPAGKETMISDAIVVLRDRAAESEQEKARQFVQMLGEAYTV